MTMKKFTLIALALAMTLGASAQRKTWDFTNGFSATTVDALQASFEANKTWTDYEKTAGEGTGVYYINLNGVVNGTASTYDAAGNATAIPEFEGLNFASIKKKGFVIVYNNSQSANESSPNGLYPYGKSYLWFNGSGMSFSFKAPAGQTLKCGIESHKNSEARGWNVFADGTQLSPISGNNVPKFYNDVEYQLPESQDGTDSVTVKFTSTNGTHLYYIIVGEGDEPEVEENKKVAFIYSPADGYDVESDFAHVFLPSNYVYTDISAADEAVTLDSLQKFDAVIIGNNVATDAKLVNTLKSAIAYEPMVNLNSKLYAAWGLGSEVAATGGNITITKTSSTFAKNLDGFDAESPTYEILTEGNNLTGVSLGEYFAADDTLATAGEALAIHQHNPLRNSYIFLPLTADLTAANADNLSPLLGAALKTVTDTKTDVTKAIKPTVTEIYADKLTNVVLSAQKNATIYYTLDGNDPTTSSAVYSDTLAISDANVTLKAIATLDGYLASDVASKVITIKTQAKAPVITAAPETGKTVVTIATDETGASVYYNFIGSSVQAESQIYTAPIELTEDATVTAFAAGGNFVQSENATEKVEISGQTEDTKRTALISHFNSLDWYDGSKAAYLFSWGKTASSIYTAEAAAAPTRAGSLKDYEKVCPDGLDWTIMSRGQVVTMENTGFGATVGDGNSYNPATAMDALPVATSNDNGTVVITNYITNFGAKVDGEPYTAVIQSNKAFQAPFDVVVYCSNGNGSSAPEIAVQVSTDGENFTTVGDTLVQNQARRLYKRNVVHYDGTDKVYVRLAHVGGGTKAMVGDIYVLGTKSNPDAIPTGIEDAVADGGVAGAKIAAIYNISGAQVGSLQHGVNIVKYTDGTVRKVLVK